jgi:PTS system N-acetylgalactosamine-specific IIA component
MSKGDPTSAAAPKAIVIGHGDFAVGMRSAVEKITGRGAELITLSGQDLSLAQIEASLRQTLKDSGVEVVFTDLQAGSATMAARKVLRDSPTTVLVVGANLPMLLDFVLSTAGSPREAVEHAVARGTSCIAVHGGAAGATSGAKGPPPK